VIEILLEAERALTVGLPDRAEQLYRQAFEADPHNSIAVVGLARVALERADEARALELARQALGIDPENDAARRLVVLLEEVLAARGAVPGPSEPPTPAPKRASPESVVETAGAVQPREPKPHRRGLFGRLFGRG
jgi:tetratricopeptide (TPR) repeat protein